jgi:lipoprotein-anchoring transpeptidase ErfK/SrfK
LPDPRSIEALPASGWKKDATPATFELPTKSAPVTAQLSDAASGSVAGFAMPSNAGTAPPSLASLTPPAATTTPLPSVAPVTATAPAEPNQGLANAIRTADRQYAADQPMDALLTLSLFYNSPDLTSSDREALISRLDPLAASVIYSRRHLLEQPHRVAANETLMEIAAKYELPWQLLANINGIEDPVAVVPGTELKVVRGPFRAEVDPTRNELTIFLRDLYAGRFKIAVGTEPAPQPGTYTIQEKQSARTFYDRNGSPVPPGDARNPYGTVWMDLGKQLCIHGSPDRVTPSTAGCISLSGNDADDLYGILSQGSSVTIRR